MATEPETPSPDVMEVWREANEAASTEIVLCEDPGCRACLAAANVIAEAKARWLAERDAEIAQLREVIARVKQAISYLPPEDSSQRSEAIAADLEVGMSLRQVAAKHGVGVGTVRGIKSRTFKEQPQ